MRGLWTAPGYALSGIDPTATHHLDDLHDTANNSPYGNPGTRTCSSDQLDAAASPLPNQNPTHAHTTAAPTAQNRVATPLDPTPPPHAIGKKVSAPHLRPTKSATRSNAPASTYPHPRSQAPSRLYPSIHPLAIPRNSARNSAHVAHRLPSTTVGTSYSKWPAARPPSARAFLCRSTRRTGHLHNQRVPRQPGHLIFRASSSGIARPHRRPCVCVRALDDRPTSVVRRLSFESPDWSDAIARRHLSHRCFSPSSAA